MIKDSRARIIRCGRLSDTHRREKEGPSIQGGAGEVHHLAQRLRRTIKEPLKEWKGKSVEAAWNSQKTYEEKQGFRDPGRKKIDHLLHRAQHERKSRFFGESSSRHSKGGVDPKQKRGAAQRPGERRKKRDFTRSTLKKRAYSRLEKKAAGVTGGMNWEKWQVPAPAVRQTN